MPNEGLFDYGRLELKLASSVNYSLYAFTIKAGIELVIEAS